MIGVVEAFSPSYALARRKFLQGCVAAGLTVEHTLQAGSGFLRQLRDEGRRLAAAWLRAPDVPPAPATLTAQPA